VNDVSMVAFNVTRRVVNPVFRFNSYGCVKKRAYARTNWDIRQCLILLAKSPPLRVHDVVMSVVLVKISTSLGVGRALLQCVL